MQLKVAEVPSERTVNLQGIIKCPKYMNALNHHTNQKEKGQDV